MNDYIHRFRRSFRYPRDDFGDLFHQLSLLFICSSFCPFYDDCRHFSRSRCRLNYFFFFFERLALEQPPLEQKGAGDNSHPQKERSENKIWEPDVSMKFKTDGSLGHLFGFRPFSLSPGFDCPSRPETMDEKGHGQQGETDSVREKTRFD